MQKIDQKTFKIIGFPDQHPFPTISAMIMRTYAFKDGRLSDKILLTFVRLHLQELRNSILEDVSLQNDLHDLKEFEYIDFEYEIESKEKHD